jgi:protein-tyrosine phosphatase
MPRWFQPGSTTAYTRVPQLDLVLPTVAQMQQAVVAIETMRASGHKVLVCCALGYSRGALCVAAWLASHLQLNDAQAAVALVRAVRPQVVLSAQSVALYRLASECSYGCGLP